MGTSKLNKFFYTLTKKEILFFSFFGLSLFFLYIQAFFFDNGLDLFMISLLATLLLMVLFFEQKVSQYQQSALEKFCQKYNLEISKTIKSLHALDKDKIDLFKNCENPSIIFYAQKNIKQTKAELYLVDHRIENKKTEQILILEIQNKKIGPGKATLISKKLVHNLKLETPQNIKTDFPRLNLKFDGITKTTTVHDILAHVNFQAILDYTFPIGISKQNGRILFFTSSLHISPESLEKFWQILDQIGVD